MLDVVIVEHFPVIDDDDPSAECVHIAHVVCRKDDRGPLLLIQRVDQDPDLRLHGHVQSDGGLIQEYDLRVVQECGQDVTEGPLTEGHLTHRLMQQILDVHQGTVETEHVLIVLIGYHVDILQDLEGFDQRERPPELASLTEDDTDVLRIFRPVFVWNHSIDQDLTGGRFQHTGHHLDGRGFACPVGTEVSYDLSAFDGKRNILHGRDGLVVPGEKILQTPFQTFMPVQNPEVLAKFIHYDYLFSHDAPPLSTIKPPALSAASDAGTDRHEPSLTYQQTVTGIWLINTCFFLILQVYCI